MHEVTISLICVLMLVVPAVLVMTARLQPADDELD
jgi:hypothetical protein